jgi:hypothetical protein
MSARTQRHADSFFIRAKPVGRKAISGVGASLFGRSAKRAEREGRSIPSAELRCDTHRENQIDHARQGARWMV